MNFEFLKVYILKIVFTRKMFIFLFYRRSKKKWRENKTFFYWKVLIVIQLTQSRNVRHDVIKEMTIAGLFNMFETPSINNKKHLLKFVFNQKMTKITFFTQHLNELNTIVNQLSFIEIKFNNEIQTLILFPSLPNN